MEVNQEELLWQELESLDDYIERILLIHQDISSGCLKYKILADNDPFRLFEDLGGNESDIETSNWALPYSYDDYIEENDLEYDSAEAELWDLEERSIEHAHDTAHWYVTGTSVINGPGDIELSFEFEFCEGYIDGNLKTPYDKLDPNSDEVLFRF
jgi:hypothetical protein